VNPWIAVWLVVAIVTTAALIAFGIALGRHVLVLGRTVRRFQEEMQPLAEDVSRQGSRASDHAAKLRAPGRRGRR
jgi:hypothetical protein